LNAYQVLTTFVAHDAFSSDNFRIAGTTNQKLAQQKRGMIELPPR